MEASPTVLAASLGLPDTLLLILLALVVLGPRRLPQIGRQMGKWMYEFRKISRDFNFQLEDELRASQVAELQDKLHTTTRGLPVDQDFHQTPDDTGKTRTEANTKGIRATEREVSHA